MRQDRFRKKPMSSDILSEAEKIIGHSFSDKSILECALTHRSYANEHGCPSNGRLEYLGDSILNFVVAEYLYRECPKDEGVLTAVRQDIVSETPLADAVRKMDIMRFYRLGRGARMNIEQFGEKPTSDIFESLLGAVYLDGGIDAARGFVMRSLKDKMQTCLLID